MPNKYLRLLVSNKAVSARKFEIVRNAAGDSADVFVYDAIVSTDAEAEWYGGVAPESFVKELRSLDAKTINLRINSPGGSVFAARAMEQALRNHPAKIVAYIDGLAASAASFLAMAADEIVMAKGAMMMIHKGWTIGIGNADDMRAQADLLDKIDGTLVQTYADRTKQDGAQILDWMAAETWFTAAEAVDKGFADRVGDAAPKNQAQWDLSAYANAPKPAETAPAPTAEEVARIAAELIAASAKKAEDEAAQQHREHQARRVRVLTLSRIE